MKISVLIAAYNGEKYIAEQIASVLSQLSPDDEVIISDDNPLGRTFNAVEPFLTDKRIKYVRGPMHGVDANKEFMLKACTGDVAFLCDQDDVWLPNKVERVIAEIEKGATCVLHDAYVTDAQLNKTGKTLFQTVFAKKGLAHNILKNGYTGACMALSRSGFEAALPFPKKIPMHDQWLGLVNEKKGKVSFINEPLILYRRNSGSLTGGKTSLTQKIIWRLNIIACLLRYERNGSD